SSSSTPTSPVWNQPPSNAAAVASGSRQYPAKTFGPRSTTSPRSPGGTGRPSGSHTCRSRYRQGRPTLPSFERVLARSRNVSPETVSVRPYASASQAEGNTRSSRSMKGIGSCAPPAMLSRTDDRSRSATPGSSSTARSIAGAIHTQVTPERSISSTTSAASNVRCTIVVAPTEISEVVVRSSAPTWYRGPHARPTSSEVNPSSATCAAFFQARFAWVIITPLGRPVVPEVYISRCTSSPDTATGSTGSAEATCSNGSHGDRK